VRVKRLFQGIAQISIRFSNKADNYVRPAPSGAPQRLQQLLRSEMVTPAPGNCSEGMN